MRFLHPLFLLLILLLPFVFIWLMRSRKPARVRTALEVPLSFQSSSPLAKIFILKLLGMAFLLIALARPQRGFHQTERTVAGIDIMLLLDVSASMNIEDLAERSRIDVAKNTLEEFILGRPNDRMGLVIFSGEPLTLSPPTLDSSLLLAALSEANTGILRDGTAIGDGLSLAVSHLKEGNTSGKVVILVTDGDNNLGQVDPNTAGELAAAYGVKVYTIAIGREGRVKMPIKIKNPLGGTTVVYQWFDNALNPQLLQWIAEKTKGIFYRVTDASALHSVFKEIDHLEKRDFKSIEKVHYVEHYGIPLLISLFFFILAQCLEWTVWRILP